jgi:hypothetical protein
VVPAKTSTLKSVIDLGAKCIRVRLSYLVLLYYLVFIPFGLVLFYWYGPPLWAWLAVGPSGKPGMEPGV